VHKQRKQKGESTAPHRTTNELPRQRAAFSLLSFLLQYSILLVLAHSGQGRLDWNGREILQDKKEEGTCKSRETNFYRGAGQQTAGTGGPQSFVA
jgi:hypothetical protein